MALKKKGKKKGFVYKGRTKDQVEKRANQQGGSFDSTFKDQFKTFKMSDGKNRVRLMPPTWDDPEHYGMDIWVHWGVGPDNQSYLCPKKHGQGGCPICEEEANAKRGGDNDYAKEIGARKRVLTWAINRDKEDEGPLLWSMPWTLDRDISAVCQADDGEVLAIDHPEDGYDIQFQREGQKERTKYVGIQVSRKQSPLSDDEDQLQEWLDFIVDNPLPEVLNFYDYDHINEQFSGGAAPSKASKDEDEEDEDEEDEEEEDEEETSESDADAELPDVDDIGDMDEDELEEVVDAHDLDVDLDKLKTLKKKRKAVAAAIAALQEDDDEDEEDEEEDDEDEEEDEEEEEEEKPAKKSKKKGDVTKRLQKVASKRSKK